jgi:uncharacterized protein YdaU (DUF1376 family)
MAKADIWMPLFIGDYLADTTRLTTEQHGAYLLLIMDYWRNGPPPDDDVVLSNITRSTASAWKKLRAPMSVFFKVEGGKWSHGRIDREIEDAEAGKLKAQTKASKAAEVRWSKQALSNAPSNAPSIGQAMLEECPSPSASPSPLKQPPKKAESAPATRLPADWLPDDDAAHFCRAERPELDPMQVGERFRDYWISQPGLKGRKTDWMATWRNWVRNERPPQARGSPSGRPEKFDPVAHVNRARNQPNERTIVVDALGEPI